MGREHPVASHQVSAQWEGATHRQPLRYVSYLRLVQRSNRWMLPAPAGFRTRLPAPERETQNDL